MSYLVLNAFSNLKFFIVTLDYIIVTLDSLKISSYSYQTIWKIKTLNFEDLKAYNNIFTAQEHIDSIAILSIKNIFSPKKYVFTYCKTFFA